jgi:hypothetical protein
MHVPFSNDQTLIVLSQLLDIKRPSLLRTNSLT